MHPLARGDCIVLNGAKFAHPTERGCQVEGTRLTGSEFDNSELEHLLARCANKDAAALESLYQRVSAQLLAVVMHILRRRDLAEDTLQEVFLRIWQQAAQYDPLRGRPLAWMISIARYRAIDLLRGQRRVVPLVEDELSEDILASDGASDSIEESTRTQRALEDCLKVLSVPQQRCLTLAYQEGLSHEAVAASLKQPLGTVKSWIRRGLKSLRRCLET
jgi:RNA polymerase sigma-70 factor (ECF subfamily)